MIDPVFNEWLTRAGESELDAAISQNPANREILTYLRNILRATGQDDIYCGLVRSPTFNACAFRAVGRDFIGLNSGAVRVFLHASLALLSSRSAFPHQGDPAQEGGDADLSGGLVKLLHAAFPQCPVRLRFAQAMFQFANTFVFCHELGHHWTGHVDFVFKIDSNMRLNETASPSSYGGLSAPTKQALELDADRAAVSLYANSLVDLGHAFQNQSEAARAWFCAMFLVFVVMAESTDGLRTYRGGTHPHPWLRLLFVIPHACHALGELTGQPEHSLRQVALETLNEVVLTWQRMNIPGHALFGDGTMREGAGEILFQLHVELARLHDLGISRVVYSEPDRADIPDL